MECSQNLDVDTMIRMFIAEHPRQISIGPITAIPNPGRSLVSTTDEAQEFSKKRKAKYESSWKNRKTNDVPLLDDRDMTFEFVNCDLLDD